MKGSNSKNDGLAKKPTLGHLSSFAGTRKKVRLERSFPTGFFDNGFVLAVGNEWLLLQQFHDFYPEGFAALRIRDITSVRSGKYERLWERMLAKEGLIDEINLPIELPLNDVEHLLKSLQARGKNIIIECERSGENKDFYIGKILDVNKSSARFANFDALGNWDERPHKILYDDITRIEFDTPYVQTFSKYLQGPCPNYDNRR